MTIEITWHLLVMIVVTVVLIVRIFTESDGELDFSAFVYGAILTVAWLIYGGIFLW